MTLAQRAVLCLALLGLGLAVPRARAGEAEAGRDAWDQGLRDLSIYHFRRAQAESPDPARAPWLKAVEAGRAPAFIATPEPDAVPALGRRIDDPLPPALAAWADGPPPSVASLVNTHNLSAAKSQQILYVFYFCGRLENGAQGPSLFWDPSPALDLAERLGGEARVLPWIQGPPRAFGPGDAAALQALGQSLAQRLHGERRLAGLYVDAPAEGLDPLFAAFEAGTRKPLMAALPRPDAEAYHHVDVVVLPLFERLPLAAKAQDLAALKAQARSRIDRGLRLAQVAGCRLLAGLPATAVGATRAEAEDPDAAFNAALAILQGAIKVGDPAYLGAAVWALRPGGAGPDPLSGLDLSPAGPSAAVWARLRLPLVNP